MANIKDFSEAIIKETELAQLYVKLAEEATNEDYKKKLKELAAQSEEKLKSVYELMNSIPWFSN